MFLSVSIFLSALFLIGITHVLALEFYLYWTYLWFDMPMHVFGGFTVALGFSMLPFFRIHIPEHLKTLQVYLVVVLAVGLLWELFEYVGGISILAEEDFFNDTSMDLVLDLLGGAVGYYLVKYLGVL